MAGGVPRGGGQQPDPADRADAASKRRMVIAARREGASWAQAAQVGGYADRGSAYNAVKEAWRTEREHLQHDLEEMRQIEDDRDDDLRRRLYQIIRAPHPVLYKGEIVKNEDGDPLQDAAPILASIAALGRIAERHALRHGINADKALTIALNARTDMEAQVLTDALFAVCQDLGLPPDIRMAMLGSAQAYLERVAHETPEQPAM